MNVLSVIFGIVAVSFGCYTALMRRRTTSAFSKLEAMKKVFGQRAGVVLHWTFYTMIPIVYGVIAIMLGLQGKSYF